MVVGAVDVLFDFGKMAGPNLRTLAMISLDIATFLIPLLSSHTASCRAVIVVSRMSFAPRKKFAFGQGTRSAIGAWHASYLKSSSELDPHNHPQIQGKWRLELLLCVLRAN